MSKKAPRTTSLIVRSAAIKTLRESLIDSSMTPFEAAQDLMLCLLCMAAYGEKEYRDVDPQVRADFERALEQGWWFDVVETVKRAAQKAGVRLSQTLRAETCAGSLSPGNPLPPEVRARIRNELWGEVYAEVVRLDPDAQPDESKRVAPSTSATPDMDHIILKLQDWKKVFDRADTATSARLKNLTASKVRHGIWMVPASRLDEHERDAARKLKPR